MVRKTAKPATPTSVQAVRCPVLPQPSRLVLASGRRHRTTRLKDKVEPNLAT